MSKIKISDLAKGDRLRWLGERWRVFGPAAIAGALVIEQIEGARQGRTYILQAVDIQRALPPGITIEGKNHD